MHFYCEAVLSFLLTIEIRKKGGRPVPMLVKDATALIWFEVTNLENLEGKKLRALVKILYCKVL